MTPLQTFGWLCAAMGIGFTALVIYAFFIKPWRLQRHYQRQGVHGTRYTPFIGDFKQLAKQHETPTGIVDWYRWLRRETQESGATHQGLSFFWRGPRLTMAIWDPELVRKVLITEQDAFIKPIILRRLLQVQSGDGLFTTEGALWRAHRKMIAPAFSASRLHAAVPIMSQQANAVVDRWLAEIDAARGACLRGVDVQPVMSDLALRVVGGAAFGTDIEPILPLFAPQKAISPAGFTLQFIMSFLPGFAQLPLPNALVGTKHVRQLRDRLLAIILRRVEERRAAAAATTADSAAGLVEGEDPASGALLKTGQSASKQALCPGQKAPAYLLDFLLDAVDESDAAAAAGGNAARAEERLTLQNVLDEARTFVISGHETTSPALCWTMYLLATHPAWKDAVRHEARECVAAAQAEVDAEAETAKSSGGSGALGAAMASAEADGAGVVLTHQAVNRMEKLGWVVNEALRLFPPAQAMGREAARDVNIDGLHIKKGTAFVASALWFQRNDEWWEEPEAFKPERWAQRLRGATKHEMSYLPFSVGSRNCIGQLFALLEMRTAVASMLLRLDWELAPGYVHHPIGQLTLKEKNGMPLVLRRAPPLLATGVKDPEVAPAAAVEAAAPAPVA